LIHICAIDDVKVTRVCVVITDQNDAVLEQGLATLENGKRWTYRTTVLAMGKAKVTVTAEDLPGHSTQVIQCWRRRCR